METKVSIEITGLSRLMMVSLLNMNEHVKAFVKLFTFADHFASHWAIWLYRWVLCAIHHGTVVVSMQNVTIHVVS